MTEALPTRALSIQQPWASLIVHGFKAVENRTWRSSFRGPILIHAGKAMDAAALTCLRRGVHPVTGARFTAGLEHSGLSAAGMRIGGYIGIADVVDCIEADDDDWFCGPYAFVLANARPIPFMAARGMLGFFKVNADG